MVRPPRSQERYHDINKTLEERLAEGEEGLVLPYDYKKPTEPVVAERAEIDQVMEGKEEGEEEAEEAPHSVIDHEDEKSELNVIPPLKDHEEKEDLILQEGLINPDVLAGVLEEEGNVELDEGEVEILKSFLNNPAPKMMQHAQLY